MCDVRLSTFPRLESRTYSPNQRGQPDIRPGQLLIRE
jgi:hypothetical protein